MFIKYFLAFIVGGVTAFAIMLSSIGPGSLDWGYELPNGCEISRINSDEIVLQSTDASTEKIEIPAFIKEFSYDERYVFSRNVDNIAVNNILDEVYYAVDTKERKICGPFSDIDELKTQCKVWNTQLPSKWYRTSPDPNLTD